MANDCPDPPAKPPSKAKGAKCAPKRKTSELLLELEDQVRLARRALREIADRLALDMEAALIQTVKDAEAIPSAPQRRAFCEKAIQRIESLKVKPPKGRLRDLKRIDRLLAELAEDLSQLS